MQSQAGLQQDFAKAEEKMFYFYTEWHTIAGEKGQET
jgi:hypothetical protein